MKATPERDSQVVAAYNTGLSIPRVSTLLGINKGTIYRILKRNSVELPNWREGQERAKKQGMVVRGGPGRGRREQLNWYP